MKTWFDLEPLLDKIDTFDKATLESFANITPPPSSNSAFHHKFDHAKQHILRRLQRMKDAEIALQNSSNNTSDDHWYKKPIGVIFLGTCAGILVFLVKYLLGF